MFRTLLVHHQGVHNFYIYKETKILLRNYFMQQQGQSKTPENNNLSSNGEQIICLLNKFSNIFRRPLSVVSPLIRSTQCVKNFNQQSFNNKNRLRKA
jgi:hypothetical protein